MTNIRILIEGKFYEEFKSIEEVEDFLYKLKNKIIKNVNKSGKKINLYFGKTKILENHDSKQGVSFYVDEDKPDTANVILATNSYL